jgi:hypothetical protein
VLTRRRFLAWAALTALAAVPLANRLLSGAGGSGAFAPPPWTWQIDGADDIEASLAVVFSDNAITVTVGGVTKAQGYRPDDIYDALWTRDHAYVLWHYPEKMTATQRRQFVSYFIERRTDGSEADPDGGLLPADFIADRIADDGTATYKNAGTSDLPFMDGIAFVVLALWSDWNLTSDTTTFDDNEAAIADCLAAIPRSANGCVYSNPAAPSVDYGFTDTVKKTGDVAYGTALQAWAYKMCAEMAGESGSGTWTTLREEAEDGLATLRKSSGWYMGSSVNNAAVDDVWATALIVAEGLVSGADRTASAQAIADAYADGSTGPLGYTSTITQFGLVRHLPVGQYWTGTTTTQNTYQNGGYWLTPLWDCVRAVALVDHNLALTWATEAMQQIEDEYTAEGDWHDVPYEWHNYGVGVGAKGYTASAAIIHRFA